MKEITIQVPVKTEHVEEVTIQLPYYCKDYDGIGTAYMMVTEEQKVNVCRKFDSGRCSVYTYNWLTTLDKTLTKYELSSKEEFTDAVNACMKYIKENML